MNRYRHIHIRGLAKTPSEYRPHRGGGSRKVTAVSDREAHAETLAEGLRSGQKVFELSLAAQAAIRVKENQRGAAFVVEGRPGQKLQTGSARSTSPTTKLLSVTRAGGSAGSNRGDTALLFLTQSNFDTLARQIDAYGRWKNSAAVFEEDEDEDSVDTAPGGKPRGFWLFETAERIRPATTADFWHGDLDDLPTGSGDRDWEVWYRSDYRDYIERGMSSLGIEAVGRPTAFVEISVQSVRCSRVRLDRLVQSTAAVVSVRAATPLTSTYFDADPTQRLERVASISDRVQPPRRSDPRIVIMDTGILATHPLLAPAVVPGGLHAVDPAWGVGDHNGHGTRMAGVAQFLDMSDHLQGAKSIEQWTRLESVVVQAPAGSTAVSAREAIERAVELVETTKAPRVFCLAQTAKDEVHDLQGTATSALLDDLAFNEADPENPRLFCVAAGNVPWTAATPYNTSDYSQGNKRWAMESPGQAFNVITVGAMTAKASGPQCVADTGDLSPGSRSAEQWSDLRYVKPDIVMEGGNFAKDPTGTMAMPSPADMVLTTSKDYPTKPLTTTGHTSAATAAASGLLGRAMYMYGEYTAESLRGLLVHSAEWTPAMDAQYTRLLGGGFDAVAARRLCMARFGWGVPNQKRLYRSYDNDLTMVIEDTIQPYEQGSSGVRLKEMKYFPLPWPKNALRALGRSQVEMKVTLSYFIEPDAHAYPRDRADRYASHRLRFDLKRVGETDEGAQRRYNALAPSTVGTDDTGWILGEGLRNKGSLHQDIWHGSALDLASRDGIAVAPNKGWWPDIRRAERHDRQVAFSLIISLKVAAEAHLYTEVAAVANRLKVSVDTTTPI